MNDTTMMWMEARDACHADGRELFSLNTEEEVRFIRNVLIDNGNIDHYWVGLNDQTTEGISSKTF